MKVVSVEIQPAVRREMRLPASVIASAPTSGASRQIQAPAITQRRQPRSALAWSTSRSIRAPRHRDDQPEPDRDLRRRDRHHGEREDLAVEVALLARERDEGEVRRR